MENIGLKRTKEIFRSESFCFNLDVEFQLNAFTEYIMITQGIIAKEIKEKIEKYNIEAKENDFRFYNNADHEIMINTYQLYFNSIFVMLFSFLEKKMYQLCKIVESKNEFNLADYSGKGVSKFKIFLSEKAQIDFSIINTEWSEINKLNDLRNIIIHSPSVELIINKDNAAKIKTLKSIKKLKYEDAGEIVSFYIEDKNLLFEFMNVIYRFLEKIYYEKPPNNQKMY